MSNPDPIRLPDATATKSGLMSARDKAIFDGVVNAVQTLSGDEFPSGGFSVDNTANSAVVRDEDGEIQAVDTKELSVDRVIIDARRYGVTADGTTDDTSAMQDAIDAMISQKGMLVLPDGVISVTSTLVIAPATGVSGFVVEGQGQQSTFDNVWGAKNKTVLRWDGAAGGTIMQLSRFAHGAVRNLSFVDGANPAGIKLHVAHLSAEYGETALSLSYLSFQVGLGRTGLQFGTASGDSNAADASLEHLSFYIDRGTGIRVKHVQGVNYFVRFVDAYLVGEAANPAILWDCERGGCIYWDAGYGTPTGGYCTILKIRGGGSNAGTFVLNGHRWEQNNNWPVVVDASSLTDGVANITVNGYTDSSGGNSNPANPTPGAFVLGPGANLTLNGGIMNRTVARMSGSSALASNLYMNHVLLPDTPDQYVVTTDAYSWWEAENCASIFNSTGNWTGSNRPGAQPIGARFHFLEPSYNFLDTEGRYAFYAFGAAVSKTSHATAGVGVRLAGANAFIVALGTHGPINTLSCVPPYSVSFWYRPVSAVPSNAWVFRVNQDGQHPTPWLKLIANPSAAGDTRLSLNYGDNTTGNIDLGAGALTDPVFLTIVVESSTVAKLYVGTTEAAALTATSGTPVSLPGAQRTYIFGAVTGDGSGNPNFDIFDLRIYRRAMSHYDRLRMQTAQTRHYF